VAVLFCTRCGCENAPARGACLRCFNPLEMPGGTVTCAECGQQAAAGADYCQACGASVNGAPPRIPCSLEAAINFVLGGEEGIGPFVGQMPAEAGGMADEGGVGGGHRHHA